MGGAGAIRLSERMVRSAAPSARDRLVFDKEARGLAVVVYRSGRKAWAVRYRVSGRVRQMVLGGWPELSLAEARIRALEVRAAAARGSDPLGDREALRRAPTLDELVERYLREHAVRLAPRSAADQRCMLERLVLPSWRGRKVADITRADVDQLLARIALGGRAGGRAGPTPVRANRCGEVLRRMFGLAVDWSWAPSNPAARFYRRLEEPRERYLSQAEIARLAEALVDEGDSAAAGIVRLCMLTGARFGEARQARFADFDHGLGIWRKPAGTTKQRRVHVVPVSEAVLTLVRQRRAVLGGELVFPGQDPDEPVRCIRRPWRRIRARAGLDGVRLHDLRHTFASALVTGGASLEVVARLLGHSQVQTTRRYAHLADGPMRAGVESVAALVGTRPRLVSGS